MLDNIRIHSFVVAGIAYVIAKGLGQAGIQISVKKAVTGALMHDIGKTLSIQIGGDHSEIGRRICLDNGLDEIADIVGEHVRLNGYRLNGEYSEKEIVYYADKRVNHDRIVSLQERLVYILERYGQSNEDLHHRIKKNFALCERIEKKLFRRLEFTPESLAETPLPDVYSLWRPG
jgi:putative nucleotidyltransferase with HDIG domain